MPHRCKIDEGGWLYFKRGSYFKRQACLNPDWGGYCNDECPYFHTHPETDYKYAELHLCNGIEYAMHEIIDERVKNDNKDNPNNSIEDDLDNINLKLEGREN